MPVTITHIHHMTISKMIRNTFVLAILIGLIVVASSVASAQAAGPVAKLTLVAPVSGTIEIGKTQTVVWKSSNYAAPTVSINVIRKIGSNPNRYTLVRTVAAATQNDGSATWVPSNFDLGQVSIEVGCTPSKVACQSGVNTTSNLAVITSAKYLNTASAFQAIEASKNK